MSKPDVSVYNNEKLTEDEKKRINELDNLK